LEKNLGDATAQLDELREDFALWRERTQPVARQFRQQQKIIRELRQELRQEMHQESHQQLRQPVRG